MNKSHVLVDIHPELTLSNSGVSVSFKGCFVCMQIELDWSSPQTVKNSLNLKIEETFDVLSKEVSYYENRSRSIRNNQEGQRSQACLSIIKQLKTELSSNKITA